MSWDLITNDTSAHVRLFDYCSASRTGQNALVRTVLCYETCDFASLSQTNEEVYVVVKGYAASSRSQYIHC